MSKQVEKALYSSSLNRYLKLFAQSCSESIYKDRSYVFCNSKIVKCQMKCLATSKFNGNQQHPIMPCHIHSLTDHINSKMVSQFLKITPPWARQEMKKISNHCYNNIWKCRNRGMRYFILRFHLRYVPLQVSAIAICSPNNGIRHRPICRNYLTYLWITN